jgi:hypothetical protein
MLGQQTNRLIPCEELMIYRWLKEAGEKWLGYRGSSRGC